MLSTVGVLITTVVTGLLIYYLSEWTRLDIGLTLPMSMLLAATVSSTDSASVFNLLRTQRIGLNTGCARCSNWRAVRTIRWPTC